jgi:hypothetical protein
VLEIWEDSPREFPLIDLGTFFTSVADLFHHIFEIGSFSNTHRRHCFSKKIFFVFFLALENMTFNADGKINLIADLSNACCWTSEISGQTKHNICKYKN